MKNYLNEQSAAMIIRNAVEIYLANFKALCLIYVVPILPLMLLAAFFKASGQQTLGEIVEAINPFIIMLVTMPMTIAVSDIGLGNPPTVGRSYRYFAKNLGPLLLTYSLLVLLIIGGFLLLIIPGIIFSFWYMLTLQVALLERLSGWKALKRSKELGAGFYWRNFGVLLLMNLIYMTFILILSFTVGFTWGFLVMTFFPSVDTPIIEHFGGFLGGAIAIFFGPPTVITPVLIYYDMRARKEGYDVRMLAEDLAK